MSQKEQTFVEHFAELRGRLMKVAFFFVAAFLLNFFLAKPLIHFLQHTQEAKRFALNAFGVMDPLVLYLKFVVYMTLVLILPVALYQLWSFVSPGLHEKERRATLAYIPYAFLLFLAGLLFSYLVLFPYMLRYATALSQELDVKQVIGINQYFDFLFQITLPFGLIFQLPIVMLFLTRLGLITPMYMVKMRKYAYFLLFVLAALITPPDVMSHLLVTLPLLVLYEVSLVVTRIGYRKYLRAEQMSALQNSGAQTDRQ